MKRLQIQFLQQIKPVLERDLRHSLENLLPLIQQVEISMQAIPLPFGGVLTAS
jgi:hypothetical protein